ncbi:MAG: hypothetical protein NTU47_11330 [Ignavibacteriales bacterium]|nr:hypothetical protein [Ignavibacteriales bacterium]
MGADVRKSSASSEQAIAVMFKGTALQFSRSLRSGFDEDPEFLEHHGAEVFPLMERHLKNAGVMLDETGTQAQMRHVIREVVVRLRSYEKGNI